MTSEHEKSSDASTVDPMEVARLLRQHAWKIFFFVAAAIGLTCAYLHRARPVYVSSGLLEVAPSDRQDPNAMEDLEASDTLKTIQLKVASPTVLLGVVRRNHLADDPSFAPRRPSRGWGNPTLAERLEGEAYNALEFLKADRVIESLDLNPPANRGPYSDAELLQKLSTKVDVNLVRGSRLIEIRAEDTRPEGAQRLAQSVIDEFFQQSWDEKHQQAAGERERLEAEAKRIGDDFRSAQERLEAYRDKVNAVSLEERQNIVVERLRDLDQQAAVAKNFRLSLAAERDQVERLAQSNPEQLLTIGAIADLPEIVDLRKQIDLQDAQVATLAKRYGPLHPTMIQARSQLEDLHTTLQASIRKAGERIVQDDLSAAAREKAIDSALAEQEQAALELDRIAIPYHSLEHEVQANATMYQKVLDQLKESDVNRGLMSSSDVDGTEIRVLEKPIAPASPDGPRQKLLLALSVVVGLVLGCGSALVSSAFDNSVSSVDDAEGLLGLPVLASIPRSRHRRLSSSPLVLDYPSSMQAEAFRSLRTALSLGAGDEARRCVLFTSAVPEEGKSFCALNFAAALAEQGFRTLLIDGDLRRPSLQRLFSGPNGQPKLIDCLKNPALFPNAVRSTSIANLSCLGNWQYAVGGAELLGRGAMRPVLEQALAGFERVVVDSAPLMAVSDTLHIAKDVATICLVVQAGKTSRRLVRRSLKLIVGVAKRQVTGVIMNKISPNDAGGRYYSYYGYGYVGSGRR